MGIGFFLQFTALDHIPRVVIENPIGIMSKLYRKPDQIIQPWQFGDNYNKSTCLWLKGVPHLKPIVTEPPELEWFEWTDGKTGKKKRQPKWFKDAWKLPANERAMVRSKTFPGIAKAMAAQWGNDKYDPKDFPEAEDKTPAEIKSDQQISLLEYVDF